MPPPSQATAPPPPAPPPQHHEKPLPRLQSRPRPRPRQTKSKSESNNDPEASRTKPQSIPPTVADITPATLRLLCMCPLCSVPFAPSRTAPSRRAHLVSCASALHLSAELVSETVRIEAHRLQRQAQQSRTLLDEISTAPPKPLLLGVGEIQSQEASRRDARQRVDHMLAQHPDNLDLPLPHTQPFSESRLAARPELRRHGTALFEGEAEHVGLLEVVRRA